MTETSTSESKSSFDTRSHITEVKSWLKSQFDGVGKDVPDFDFTPESVSYLHNLATQSQARTRSSQIVAADFRQKAFEYRLQAARIWEILESVGLTRESLSPNIISSTKVIATMANLLNIRDTELSSFLVAMADISLRKTVVEEKRSKAENESKLLLDYTRKAITRLTHLKRVVAQLEDDVAPCEGQMENWKINLGVMASKERQYMQQYSNYKSMLSRVGYSDEISHRVLVEMSEQKKEVEKETKPILDTLRSYQDLPPDKALAALAIEEKKRQFVVAEKHLDQVLQSTFPK